jgi:hypothetical protein
MEETFIHGNFCSFTNPDAVSSFCKTQVRDSFCNTGHFRRRLGFAQP